MMTGLNNITGKEFPAWEQSVSSVETGRSQRGNEVRTAGTSGAYYQYVGSVLCSFRYAACLLLLMVVGVGSAWGQPLNDGLYYIKSDVNANPNYYLCPAIGCYYNSNVDQPHLTTYQSKDQNSVWEIKLAETEVTGNNAKYYYYIIHYKTGRYLISNEDFTTDNGTKHNRKAVHLEVKPETLTDNFKFCINGSQVYPKVYWNSDVANMSFNPTGNNQNCYAPNNGEVQGIIGLYDSNDNGSKWNFIPVPPASTPCATPIIKYNGDNISISYPYSDETGITIYYTTDGTDPATSGTRSSYSEPISASGVIKVRAIATKTGLVNSDEAVLWGSARPFLIQSKECADYYLVPAGNGTNVNTSSLPGTSMQWTLQNAGASTGGVQYYYVVNSNSKKINYNSSDNTLTLNDASVDANKFCVFENGYGTGNFFLIPVSQTNRVLYKNKGNVEADNCKAELNKKWDTNLDQWNLIACNETADQKNLFSTAPFNVSNDNETHYYHIASVQTQGYYIVPPTEANGYATTSNTDYNNTPWLFKVAASDNWLTYYYIINAASGKYMYFNPNNNQTANQENVISLKEISEKNADNEEKFQFIMVRSTTTDACYIVPKGYSYADASHINFNGNKYFGIWLNETGPLKATWNRSSAGNVKWTFEEAEITNLYLNPVFSQDESGNITITHPTAACDIHYTIDGTDPSTSSAIYDNTNGLSTTEQRRIKAKAKLKTNSSIVSDVAFLLNKPDITVSSVTYTGTALPAISDISEVSIGDAPNKTTAPSGTYEIDYANCQSNINVPAVNSVNLPTVVLKDVAGDNWYIWNASTTFTISPASVTVKADDKTKEYGTPDPAWTATVTGMQNGESAAEKLNYTFSRTEGESIAGSPYTITPSGEANQGNYIVTSYENGTLTITQKSIGDGSIATGFTYVIESDNSITLKDGETTLTDVDYFVASGSEPTSSGKYTTRTVSGRGNYTGSFNIRNAIVHLKNDNNGGTEYSATFVAESAGNTDIGHALPEGMTAYIITDITGDWAIPEQLDYIPAGVPVLLLANNEINGFEVKNASNVTAITPEQIAYNKLKRVTAESAHFNTKEIYVLYKNEFVLNKGGDLGNGKVYMENPNYVAPSPAPSPAPTRLKIKWDNVSGMAELRNDELTESRTGIGWYTIDGRRLNGKPEQRGLYIVNGKKVMVK